MGYQTLREPLTNAWIGLPTRIVLPRLRSALRLNQSSAPHAVIDVTQFVENFPDEAVKEYKNGLRAKDKGKMDLAIVHLEKAVFLAPDFCDAHTKLGALYQAFVSGSRRV